MLPQETVRAGRIGKQIVMHCLTEAGYHIHNRMEDPASASKFIDCDIVDPNTGDTSALFIVSDTRMGETGNIFVERYISRVDRRTGAAHVETGWLELCQADVIGYLDVINGTLRLYNWPELQAIARKTDIGKNHNFYDQIDRNATVLCFVVPMTLLETYKRPDDIEEPDADGKIKTIEHPPVYLGAYKGLDTSPIRNITTRAGLPF